MGKAVSQLTEITARELSQDDYLLISDVWDEQENGTVSKKMKVSEFVKYIKSFRPTKIEWRCIRCKSMVDMKKFRCKCKTSPSPWEPI